MSEWSEKFSELEVRMTNDSRFTGISSEHQRLLGLLHAAVLSWSHESDCLVWITSVPGTNIFGSTVMFVNDRILSTLQWTLAEWEDGTAPSAVFNSEDRDIIQSHITLKSTAPMLARVRKKNTPPNQDGNLYRFHIHHDLPYNLRVTIAVPVPKGI